MNIKGLILVFIALGLGAATLFLARGWLETNSTQNVQIVSQESNTIDVLVATKNLPAGHIANSSDFEWQPWPDKNINQNYISRDENNTNEIEGRIISYGITAGKFRNDRMMKAEEKAARLPAIMTIPLILFILPVLFIVLLGPAACSVSDNVINRGF